MMNFAKCTTREEKRVRNDYIIKLHKAGMRKSEISRQLNVGYDTVFYTIKKYGTKNDKEEIIIADLNNNLAEVTKEEFKDNRQKEFLSNTKQVMQDSTYAGGQLEFAELVADIVMKRIMQKFPVQKYGLAH